MCDRGLSGRLWPLHCKPYDDEVLSSWLTRLSRAYSANPIRFCSQVWPHQAVWQRDIDKGTDDELLRVLSAKTATSRGRVLATTVRGYSGYRMANLRGMRRPPWLLRAGLRSFTRSQPWLQYCSLCLQADADPYFRRCWRLAFVTVCPAHHRRLLDRCVHCGAVINFHCLPGDAKTMTLCSSCQYDARCAPAPTIDASIESRRLVQFQTFLLKAMRSGRCRLWSFHSVQSALFFEVLHKRVQFFLTTMHAPLFREAFSEYLTASSFASHFRAPRPRSIEVLGVEDRLAFMLFVSWWFDRRPEGLMHLNSESDLRQMGHL